jgi:hypothetical protein
METDRYTRWAVSAYNTPSGFRAVAQAMTDDLNEPAEVHWAQMIGLLILVLLLFLILFAATGDPPFSWGVPS